MGFDEVNLIALAGSAQNLSNTGDRWSITNLFMNAGATMKTVGSALLVLLGIIMIIVAGVKIAKGLMGNSQQQQTNWLMIAALLIVGGMFAVGGFTLISQIAAGGQDTVQSLGEGISSTIYAAQHFLP